MPCATVQVSRSVPRPVRPYDDEARGESTWEGHQRGPGHDVARGLDALRAAVAALHPPPTPALALAGAAGARPRRWPPASLGWLLTRPRRPRRDPSGGLRRRRAGCFLGGLRGGAHPLIALVELARKGDAEAFGLLYDHYQASVYRFLYYRTRSSSLAEDLTSETFFRALRNMATSAGRARTSAPG